MPRPLEPRNSDLVEIFDGKYFRFGDLDWGPRLRQRFGYFNPDDHYEAVMSKLVPEGCRWIDVGCGRDIFPSNPDLSRDLAARCSQVIGVDPDPNVRENPYISEWHQGPIEEFEPSTVFELVSLRMVAEHVEFPKDVVEKLKSITSPGGKVILYTPFKWAPVSIVARLTPMWFHHLVKRVLWGTLEQDTFPVQFKMNTRTALQSLFEPQGFTELYFTYLDDCRVFNNFKALNFLELSIWKLCKLVRIPYPERCILAVFQRD